MAGPESAAEHVFRSMDLMDSAELREEYETLEAEFNETLEDDSKKFPAAKEARSSALWEELARRALNDGDEEARTFIGNRFSEEGEEENGGVSDATLQSIIDGTIDDIGF